MIKLLMPTIFVSTLAVFSPAVVETPFQSVRPLSLMQVDETGTEYRRQVCTAFSVKLSHDRVWWLTAAHCVKGMETLDIWIGQSPAKMITISSPFDVAVLTGEESPGLTFALNEALPTEGLRVIGYSFGWISPQYREGVRAGHFRETGTSLLEDTNQIAVAPGDSGSPVLNTSMQVVGMMKRVFCGGQVGFCPMGGSVTLSDLKFVVSMHPIE